MKSARVYLREGREKRTGSIVRDALHGSEWLRENNTLWPEKCEADPNPTTIKVYPFMKSGMNQDDVRPGPYFLDISSTMNSR